MRRMAWDSGAIGANRVTAMQITTEELYEQPGMEPAHLTTQEVNHKRARSDDSEYSQPSSSRHDGTRSEVDRVKLERNDLLQENQRLKTLYSQDMRLAEKKINEMAAAWNCYQAWVLTDCFLVF